MRSLRICTALAVATAAVHIHSSDASLLSEKRLRGEILTIELEGSEKKVTELNTIEGSTDNCLTEINDWRRKIHPDLKPYEELKSTEEYRVHGSVVYNVLGAATEQGTTGKSRGGTERGQTSQKASSAGEKKTKTQTDEHQLKGHGAKEVIDGQEDAQETEDAVDEEEDAGTQTNPSKKDLETFLTDKTCKSLKAGTFAHISGEGDNAIFVVSASNTSTPTKSSSMTCSDVVSEFEKGFSVFGKANPPAYTDNDGLYADPNAVGLISLLSESNEKVFCGIPKECEGADTIVCYFKPSFVKASEVPVKPLQWHYVQEYFGMKPTFKQHDGEDTSFLNAVNGVRQKEELGLPGFTAIQVENKKKLSRTNLQTEMSLIESALLDITCDALTSSTLNPAAAEGYTVIYNVKEGSTPPTCTETVEYWEGGYEKLNYNLPPAFGAENTEGGDNEGDSGDTSEGTGSEDGGNKGEENNGDDDERGDGNTTRKTKTNGSSSTTEGSIKLGIYEDSQVAGYVSLMTDKTRKMVCFNATGCSKAAIVCVLKEATLVKDEQPISSETWEKISTLKGVTKPTISALASENNCLAEINAVRTQENMGLEAFVASTSAAKTLSTLMSSVTCQNLKAGTVKPTIGGSTSLMYFSAAEATCEKAVADWKSGMTSFADVETPPAYSADLDLYRNKAASNFVSLMTDSKKQTATCYSAKECEEDALVCELKPAALKEGVVPISAEKWKVITTVLNSGAAQMLSSAALLCSALLALLAFALQL